MQQKDIDAFMVDLSVEDAVLIAGITVDLDTLVRAKLATLNTADSATYIAHFKEGKL